MLRRRARRRDENGWRTDWPPVPILVAHVSIVPDSVPSVLVSFAVTNWACFRDRQELSAEAVRPTDDAFAFDTGVRRIPRLNRVTAVYGANGSGKSRLLQAWRFMKTYVVGSAAKGQAGDDIGVVPFLFDAKTKNQPTVFEACFIAGEGMVYEYLFSLDHKRIHEERLSSWSPGGRRRGLLHRKYDTEVAAEEWRFGATVRGPKSVWRSSTRENALFVSVAAQLNSDTFRPVVDWFQRVAFVTPAKPGPMYTASRIADEDDFHNRVMTLLRDADIRGKAIETRERSVAVDDVRPHVPPSLLNRVVDEGKSTFDVIDTSIVHPVAGDAIPHALDLTEESDGTQHLFALAGLWLDVLDNDRIVVVDELDSSLHPLLVAALVRRINGHNGGRGKAQLVATLHDVSLLRNVLHRGQIWLTEKVPDTGACSVEALSDYRRRPKEEIMTDYLDGRFGGIPVIIESSSVDDS